jgi:hypothetical protein
MIIFQSDVHANKQAPIKMPDEIKKVKDVKVLKKYIGNSDMDMRISAVKRVSEINGPDSIDVLCEFYRKEPKTKPVFGGRVQEEAIKALGNIKNIKAKKVLLEFMNETLLRKPIFKYSDNEDAEYFRIFYALIGSLGRWEDEDVKQKFLEISNNLNINYMLRENSYEQVLKIEMKQMKLDTSSKQIPYLVGLVKNEETEWVTKFKDQSGPEAFQAMQTLAALQILRCYKVADLPVLEDCYNEIPESKTVERNAIGIVINYLKVVNKSDVISVK